MKLFRSFVVATVGLAGALSAGACGDDGKTTTPTDGGTAPDAAGLTGSYMPWKVGNTWTYRVTDNGVVDMKITTVGALEAVGGAGPNKALQANKVTTTKGTNDQTISWQALVGERVLRYREQSFHAMNGELELEEHWDPAKLHFDLSSERTKSGATWLETYNETKAPVGQPATTAVSRDRWNVTGVDQIVTVPAGTFRALVLTKAGGSNAKTYWFAKGVGKVKETGGQTEELVSYQVAP